MIYMHFKFFSVNYISAFVAFHLNSRGMGMGLHHVVAVTGMIPSNLINLISEPHTHTQTHRVPQSF